MGTGKDRKNKKISTQQSGVRNRGIDHIDLMKTNSGTKDTKKKTDEEGSDGGGPGSGCAQRRMGMEILGIDQK